MTKSEKLKIGYTTMNIKKMKERNYNITIFFFLFLVFTIKNNKT